MCGLQSQIQLYRTGLIPGEVESQEHEYDPDIREDDSDDDCHPTTP